MAHQYAAAVPVTPAAGTYDPGWVDVTAGYDAPETAPPGMSLTGYRAAWYRYAPQASAGSVNAQGIAATADLNTALPNSLTIFEVDGAGTWTQVTHIATSFWSTHYPWDVTAGHTYYLRVAADNPDAARLRLTMTQAPDGAVPPDPNDTSAHQWDHALLFGPPLPPAGYYDTGPSGVDVTGFTGGERNPTGGALPGYRALWAAYTPSADATGVMADGVVGSGNAIVHMWSVDGGVWTLLGAGAASVTTNVVAGRQYYLRAASTDPNVTLARLLLLYAPAGTAPTIPALPMPPIRVAVHVGAAAVDPPGLPVPPITVAVRLSARLAGDPLPVPPITAAVRLGVPALTSPVIVAAPPALIGIVAPPPVLAAGTITLDGPVDVTVGSARPVFTVTVTADAAGQQVEVQYAADAAFVVTATATAPAPAGLADTPVTVTAGTDLTDGQVWWRARLTGPYGPGAWTGAATFTVDTLEGQAVAAGTFTIAAVPAPAHLWHIDYAATDTTAGGTGLLVGTGFGTAPTVLLGDLPCPVIDTVEVADTGAGDDRRIDDAGISVWHQQVTFTIPDVDADHVGDTITVRAGG